MFTIYFEISIRNEISGGFENKLVESIELEFQSQIGINQMIHGKGVDICLGFELGPQERKN